LAAIAAGTLGAWWVSRRRKKRRSRRKSRHKQKNAPLQEASAAAHGRFPEEDSETETHTVTETFSPIERDDREARQLLRLSQLEGRDPLQDALAGRLALDRLDEIAESNVEHASFANELRRELRERFNDVAPTKFQPRASATGS